MATVCKVCGLTVNQQTGVCGCLFSMGEGWVEETQPAQMPTAPLQCGDRDPSGGFYRCGHCELCNYGKS